MRRGFACTVVVMAACGHRARTLEVDPVTVDQATAFGPRLAALVHPCDQHALEALVDERALAVAVANHADPPIGDAQLVELPTEHGGAKGLCAAGIATEDYRMLRVRVVDGAPHLFMRRLARLTRTNVVAVNYDEIALGASKDDHQIRVIDFRPMMAGEWVSESIAELLGSALRSKGDVGGGQASIDTLKRARQLLGADQPLDALAALDRLPDDVRHTRAAEMLRVRAGNAISSDAYQHAIDEAAAQFPAGDPSLAMLEIDGAVLHKDYDAALRAIDVVDRAVGGDPFQDAVRAEVYLLRGHAGDLELARARALAATDAEPTLAKGWWARFDVERTAHHWADAVAAMDQLRRRFGTSFSASKLAALDPAFVATPDYAAWRDDHPDAIVK